MLKRFETKIVPGTLLVLRCQGASSLDTDSVEHFMVLSEPKHCMERGRYQAWTLHTRVEVWDLYQQRRYDLIGPDADHTDGKEMAIILWCEKFIQGYMAKIVPLGKDNK